MKNKLVVLCIGTVFAITTLSGCNYDLVDTTYTFTDVQIKMPDGSIIKGKVDKWKDYEDGDQLQITVDGVTYLVHSSNVTLIKK